MPEPYMKKWTTNEPLPEQMRWKVSSRDGDGYYEVESDSLWVVIRVLFVIRKIALRKKISALKKKIYGRI